MYDEDFKLSISSIQVLSTTDSKAVVVHDITMCTRLFEHLRTTYMRGCVSNIARSEAALESENKQTRVLVVCSSHMKVLSSQN